MSEIGRRLQKLEMKLAQRMRGIVRYMTLAELDDSTGVQTVKAEGAGSDVRSKVERMQPYGLSSMPAPSSEAIGVSVGGKSDHVVIIACEERSARPTDLADGEVTLYARFGQMVHLKTDGTIEIHKGGTVDFVALAQKVLDELNDIRTKFDSHTHTTTATVDAGPVGAVAPPSTPMGAASSVAASKVKAE